MSEPAHSHRATTKNAPKPHKTGHASKSTLRDNAKGRTLKTAKTKSAGHSAAGSMQQTKAARKNTAKQLQKAKKAGLIAANRLHSSGGEAKAPRVVTVLSLCPDCDPASIVEQLLASADVPMPAKNGSIYQAEFVFYPPWVS